MSHYKALYKSTDTLLLLYYLLSGSYVCVHVDRYGERTATADGVHSDAVPARQYLPLCSPRRRRSRTI